MAVLNTLEFRVHIFQHNKLTLLDCRVGQSIQGDRHGKHVLQPFNSVKADDDSWTHTATDISGEAASVQAIANAAWTDAVKAAYKTMREAQE